MESKKKFFVYRHISKTTGKCYIGYTSKSIETRWKKHLQHVLEGSEYHFHRAIRLYGKDDWFTEKLGEFNSAEEALKAEAHWINHFSSCKPDFGYNSTTGGEHPASTPETRKRLSEAQKRRWEKPEEHEKARIARKKHPPISDAQKEKLRQGKLGAKNPYYGKNHPILGKKLVNKLLKT